MCTVYFSKRDYRKAMRDSTGSARSHAICRRLLGVPACYERLHGPHNGKVSLWYGAHYYAACALTSERSDYHRGNDCPLEFWRRAFAREATGCDGRDNPPMSLAVWALWVLAVRRVREILPEAMELSTSVLW
jgi:hypothetical protein